LLKPHKSWGFFYLITFAPKMSQELPKVISFIDWYAPAYKAGGPVRSMINMVQLMHDKINFLICCSNSEIDGLGLSKNPEKLYVGYFGEKILYRNRPLFKKIKELTTPQTCFHINGIYSWNYSILPLLFVRFRFRKNRLVISPRGMLNPGALKIKTVKKLIFIQTLRLLKLTNKAIWHVTSDGEKTAVLKHFPSTKNIIVLSNIPILPSEQENHKVKVDGELNMFSVTRVVPIKRLETILLALKNYPIEANIIWDIYGPIEDESYCSHLINLAMECKNLKISFKNSLNAHELQNIASYYHLFCLPSDNENFGHAIYESFAFGVPVLISDQTPWKDLEKINAGFDLNHDALEDFSKVIHQFAEMNHENWTKWSIGASEFAKSNYLKDDWIKGYMALFAND
jgi:glycosyltransferase involved in cell wall biosynthesis